MSSNPSPCEAPTSKGGARKRHSPLRMCAGCRQMMAKNELFRVVKSPEGEISVDLSGKKPGRGVYLCKSEQCFNKALKSKALSRAFKAPIPDEILQSMEGFYGSNS